MSDSNTTDTTETSAIEQALAAAQGARAASSEEEASPPPPTVSSSPTPEEAAEAAANEARAKAEKRAAKEAAREAKKAEAEKARAEKKAIREAKKAAREAERANFTPHMAKVEKAAESLPDLGDDAQDAFNSVESLSNSDLSSVIAWAEHTLRVRSTQDSQHCELEVGQTVRVTAGVPAYLGLEGTVSKTQRIRCLVDVPGKDKPIYLFASDVEVIEAGEVSEDDEDESQDSEAVAS